MSFNSIRPKQLEEVLSACVKAGMNVMITGAPGIGKTQITEKACAAAGASMVLMYASVSDPTDFSGLPFIVEGKGEHISFRALRTVAENSAACKRTVVFLDDFGQGTPATQAAAMQLLDKYRSDPSVSFVVATNRRQDRAGVSGVLEPVKSRFSTIVELQSTLEDWVEWALGAEIAPEVIAFMRFRPDLLHKFTPTQDLTNSPSPRTWTSVSNLLHLNLSSAVEIAAIAGAVGEGAAGEFVAFLREARTLPDLDSIIASPETAPIPDQPSTLYAVVSGLAIRATLENFAAIAKYASRMGKVNHGEFSVLLMRDACNKNRAIAGSTAFVELLNVDNGKLRNLICGQTSEG